jgi:hypothetical protein
MNESDVVTLEKDPSGNGVRLTVNGEVLRMRWTAEAANDLAPVFGRNTIEGLITEAMAKEIAVQRGIEVPESYLLNLLKAAK